MTGDGSGKRSERCEFSWPVVGEISGPSGRLEIAMRTVRRDRARFYELLAQLVGASVPVLAALRVVEQGEGRTRLGWAALRVGDRIRRRGATLAGSLAERSELFGSWQIEQVKLGESSGRLAHHLAFLAGEEKESVGYFSKIGRRLVLPVLALQIVPVILALPDGFRSAFVERAIPLALLLEGGLLLVLLLAWGGAWLGRRSRWVGRVFDFVPVVGAVRRGRAVARYARGLSEALASGATREEAFESTRTVIEDSAFAARVRSVEQAAVSGAPTGRVLAAVGLFPPACRELLESVTAKEDLPGLLAEVATRGRERARRSMGRGVLLVCVLTYGSLFVWLLIRIVLVLTQDLALS